MRTQTDKWMDRHDEATTAFCNFVNARRKGMAKQTGREIKPHVEAETN
jgi:hypothetical protein